MIKRIFVRAALWILILSLLLSGLWIANRFWPQTEYFANDYRKNHPSEIPSEGVVKKVLDGDTLVLEGGALVRLKGIDTPERNNTGYEEACKALRLSAEGKKLFLSFDEGDEEDRYHRFLAFLTSETGLDINKQLLSSGRAWIYRLDRKSERMDSYLKAQQEAIRIKAGLWAKLSEEDVVLWGNISSFVFHKNGSVCEKRISSKNKRAFMNPRQAFLQGYSPCRRCLRRPHEGF